MAVSNDADLSQPFAEISGISGQLFDAVAAFFGSVQAHDDLHRGDDLLRHRWRHGTGVAVGMAVDSEEVDQFLEEDETYQMFNTKS